MDFYVDNTIINHQNKDHNKVELKYLKTNIQENIKVYVGKPEEKINPPLSNVI